MTASPSTMPTPATLQRPTPRPAAPTPLMLRRPTAPVPAAPAVASRVPLRTVALPAPRPLTGHPLAAESGWLPGQIATARLSAHAHASRTLAHLTRAGAFGDLFAGAGPALPGMLAEVLRKVTPAMAAMTGSQVAGRLLDTDMASMTAWVRRGLQVSNLRGTDAEVAGFARAVADSLLDGYAPFVRTPGQPAVRSAAA